MHVEQKTVSVFVSYFIEGVMWNNQQNNCGNYGDNLMVSHDV